VGKSLRLEGLQIMLEGTDAQKYSVEYQTQVQNIGWQPWVKDGAVAGTSGKSLKLETVTVRIVEKK
ncbi:MAG: glucosaminidase domain-containing protein, partial [Clostridium sp.]